MDELVASVQEKGVLQPIVATSDRIIVIGHRRHKAAEICGARLPCLIKDYEVIEQQEIMLIENLQRQDLDPLREGQAYARLVESGQAQSDIARSLGTHESRVYRHLLIAAFPEDIGQLFAALELPVSAAEVLQKIDGEDELRRIVGMIVTRRLSIPAIKKLVKETVRVKNPLRSYRRSQPRSPQGIIRDDLVAALAARATEQISIGDLVRELEYICCACGLGATAQGRETLCSACPLTAFLNRFTGLPVKPGTPTFELMARTAPGATR